MSDNPSFTTETPFNISADEIAKQSYERRFKSPIFSFANANSILSNATYLIDFFQDNPVMQKYGSFNYGRVVNNSSSEITLYANQDTSQGIPIPAGAVVSIDESVVGSFTSLLFKNTGGITITANQLKTQTWKDRTDTNAIATQLHKRFFGKQSFSDSLMSIFNTSNTSKKGVI